MGFHKREIKKGVYGELSKIQEELDEVFDAEEQGQDLMLLIELSDMVGAIEGVALKILDNKDNDWITKHGTGYDRVDKIAAYLSEEFGDVEKKYSNLTWNYRGKVITMSNNKDYLEKDLDSLYWYGDDLLKRN